MSRYRLDFGRSPLVVVRSPTLPVETLALLGDDEFSSLEAFLHSSPLFRAAIAIASPDLLAELERGSSRKALLRVASYLSRMSSRSTPFGLFSGVAVTNFGDSTSLTMVDEPVVRVRPDAAYQRKEILSLIDGTPQIEKLRVISNQMIWKVGARLACYHSDAFATSPGHHGFALSFLAATPLTERILAESKDLVRFSDLLNIIAAATTASRTSLSTALVTMLRGGFLIPEFLADPTRDSTRRISRVISECADRDPPRTDPGDMTFTDFQTFLKTFDFTRSGSSVQIDTRVGIRGSLGPTVRDEVTKFCDLSLRFAAGKWPSLFRDRFLARYEGTNRLVPLLEAAETLLHDVAPTTDPTRVPNSAQLMFLSNIAMTARSKRMTNVELTEADLHALAPITDDIPRHGTYDVGFCIIGDSASQIDAGRFVIAPARIIGANSAGGASARFWDILPGYDEALTTLVASAYGHEVTAEIVFAPRTPRLGNVVSRTTAAQRRLFLGVAPLDSDQTGLRLQHLFVTVVDNRLALWSSELDAFIRPIQSDMFASRIYAPPIVDLLLEIGAQGLGISPMTVTGSDYLAFIPRLTYGRLILSEARWRFGKATLSNMNLRDDLNTYLDSWDVPRYVNVGSTDSVLLVDRGTTVGRELLLDQIRRTPGSIVLTEALQRPGTCWLQGEKGTFAPEFVVSIALEPSDKKVALSVPAVVASSRTAPDWLYAKLYTSEHSMDQLCIRLRVLLMALNNAVSDWHFVRYSVPTWHVRVRFLLKDSKVFVFDALSDFAEKLITERLIFRYETSVFEPEFERYGGPECFKLVQAAFSDNSTWILDTLQEARKFNREHRILWALDHWCETGIAILESNELQEMFGSLALAPKQLSTFSRKAVKDRRELPKDVLPNAEVSSLRKVADYARSDASVASAPMLFRSIGHMHFNRCGLSPEEETEAMYILWHVARSTIMKRSKS